MVISVRKYPTYIGFMMMLLGAVLNTNAYAADIKEIDSITVLTDSKLTAPLTQLASAFARQNMVSVANIFGNSTQQEKKIEEGDSADLFITSDMNLIQQLKVKGMVDVYSISSIASDKDEHFSAAVVAGENMNPARGFLKFLKSDAAHAVFRTNGLTAP